MFTYQIQEAAHCNSSLPGALWRMIGLVHDPHVRKLLLIVGILAQLVSRRNCEFLKALEILPI